MNALEERWPELAAIARIPIATLPTPVGLLEHVSLGVDANVWVKRDDVSAPRYGGNKVRKLEYILGHAKTRRADTLITTGSLGSHHVFATALYGREHGFEVHAVLTPQPYHPLVEEQLRADLALGARLSTAKGYLGVAKEMTELALRLKLWGQKPYVVPAGGSTVHGTLAYVNAGVELAHQIDAGLCPDPDAVYVACASAATVSGLALGLAAAGLRTRVIAVRVGDLFLANTLRMRSQIARAEAFVRTIEPRFPRVAGPALRSIELDHIELGKGHGLPTPSSEAARQLAARDDLALDPTYTSKAFACMLRDAEAKRRGRTLLFWNTYSSAPLAPFLAGAPEVPEEFMRMMTLAA